MPVMMILPVVRMYCEEHCCELKEKYEHMMKDALTARYLLTPNHEILSLSVSVCKVEKWQPRNDWRRRGS